MSNLIQEYEFSGSHIYADIYNLTSKEVNDVRLLQIQLEDAIIKSGATICGCLTKNFEPSGFTCLYLLAESHASIHTYPDHNAIFFDAFTCGAPDTGLLLKNFLSTFAAPKVTTGHIERGRTPVKHGKVMHVENIFNHERNYA